MNSQTLIIMVLGVIIVVGGAYLVISPRAERALTGGAESPSVSGEERFPVAGTDVTTESETEVSRVDRRGEDEREEREDETEDEDEDDDERGSALPVTTTSPAPTGSMESAPAPAPAPAQSASNGYTLTEVARHNDATSCWTAIAGSVYDVTAFIKKHPGGEKRILNLCGKDGTTTFTDQHAGQSRPENTLASYRIGALIE